MVFFKWKVGVNMMSGNTELLFWRTNKLWYKYDENKKAFELTDKATERAKNSFKMWKEFNGLS